MFSTGFPTDGPTLGDIGEHAAIQVIVDAAPSSVNGDDAAVLMHASPNSRAVATTDMLVEGRHFRSDWTTPFQLGRKAIVQNFADVEAMGARPIAALLAISAPVHTPVAVVRGIAEGIASRCDEYAAELVGGDLTAGEQLVLSVTAIGSLGGNLPELSLDRARVGQRVVAHGRIGYSAAGLALLSSGRKIPDSLVPLVESHQAPCLTPGRGVIARAAGATAMTDNSDGLVQDLQLIATRSGVGINVSSVSIQPDALLIEAGELLGVDPWLWVLSGGEDHTLLGTTSGQAPAGFRSIGQVTKGDAVRIDGRSPKFGEGWHSF
ncbi:thiamine-phosphate kinase [Corynebacterium breve]|uniref:Thiamine-monophosphate kinase n=1 Tax=Corynebacterium breve TaxID=3049799 RepID=A0ABY8VJB9_9CORY|nr:thiamine-phosphate kinase [Corynebacterium breve]WIM68723.1 thiamine-phosphate kinase [Corynebacterium breve]